MIIIIIIIFDRRLLLRFALLFVYRTHGDEEES